MPQLPIPRKAEWEANMLTWGRIMGQRIAGDIAYYNSFDEKLNAVYYDGAWVLYQIGQYQNLATEFNRYAQYANQVYVDYLVPAGYAATGFRTFAHGFEALYNAGLDASGQTRVQTLVANAGFTRDSTPLSGTADANGPSGGYGGGIREAAYCIQTYMIHERMGLGVRTKRDGYIDQMIDGILPQLFIQHSTYIKPFMVGLAAEALIMFHEQLPNHARHNDVVPILTIAADYMWDNMWVANNPSGGAFRYRDIAGDGENTDPAVDLNMLVAPLYAWLYHQTGEVRFRDRGDQVFYHGVTIFDGPFIQTGPYIVQGKQFNENYRWAMRYITWREQDPLTTGGGGSGGGGGGGTGGGGGGGGGGSGGGSGGGGSPGGGSGLSTLVSGSVPAILVPVINESWDQHFTNNGWSNIQDQIDDQYTLYIQPGAVDGVIEEKFDLGAVVTSGTLVTLSLNPEPIAGTVDTQITLSLSSDNATYTDYADTNQVFASNFRYIKIRLEFTGDSNRALARIPQIRIRVAAKEKRDGGSGQVTNATTGVVVSFNKTFVDIDSITVTAAFVPPDLGVDQEQLIAVYDFDDVPNPTDFTVYLFKRSDGTKSTGSFSWTAKGI